MLNAQAPARAAFWMKFAAWWMVPETGMYVCAPAKCGSMSLRKALFGRQRLTDVMTHLQAEGINAGPYSPWEVATFNGPKVLAVRHPLQRFESLWRDKCSRPSQNFTSMHGRSPTDLMNAIDAFPYGETHWLPQAFYCVPGVKLVRYESVLNRLGLERVAVNRSPKVAIPPVPVRRVLRHYAADLQLFKKAKIYADD